MARVAGSGLRTCDTRIARKGPSVHERKAEFIYEGLPGGGIRARIGGGVLRGQLVQSTLVR